MWTGNCPNCGEPHGGEALKTGMRVLCLRCLTPFTIPPPPAPFRRLHRVSTGRVELLWDRDDDRDQT